MKKNFLAVLVLLTIIGQISCIINPLTNSASAICHNGNIENQENTIKCLAKKTLEWITSGDFASLYDSFEKEMQRNVVWESFFDASWMKKMSPGSSSGIEAERLLKKHIDMDVVEEGIRKLNNPTEEERINFILNHLKNHKKFYVSWLSFKNKDSKIAKDDHGEPAVEFISDSSAKATFTGVEEITLYFIFKENRWYGTNSYLLKYNDNNKNKIVTYILIEIKDDHGIVQQLNSHFSLVRSGSIGTTEFKKEANIYKIEELIFGGTKAWLILKVDGNLNKKSSQYIVWEANFNSAKTVKKWSEWYPALFIANKSPEFDLLYSRKIVDKITPNDSTPIFRYRIVRKDISNGFPGEIIPSED